MPMRQLRSCDFCGDDAAGVYEVLPPALSPTEAEQHRVVLCADCVGTLEAVVNPLLRRLGVDTEGSDATAEPEDSEPAPNAAADPPSRPPNATGGSSTPPERSPTGGEPTGGPDRPAEPSGGGTEAPDHDDTGPRAGDGPSPAGSEPSRSADSDPTPSADPDPPQPGDGDSPPAADGPVEWGATGPTPADDETADAADPVRNGIPNIDPSPDADPEPEASPSASETGRSDGDDNPDAAGGEDRDAGGDGGVPTDEPDEFRTVMRLLGNREFPVDRGAIVELAASAYELDDAHVHRCLDYAVDRGVLDDDGGTLRRG